MKKKQNKTLSISSTVHGVPDPLGLNHNQCVQTKLRRESTQKEAWDSEEGRAMPAL